MRIGGNWAAYLSYVEMCQRLRIQPMPFPKWSVFAR